MIFQTKTSFCVSLLLIASFLKASSSILSERSVISGNEYEDVYYPALNWSDEFDWKLFKSVDRENQNILISPFSLKIALAIIYEGAGGLTENEFQKVLNFESKEIVRSKFNVVIEGLKPVTDAVDIRLATRLFLDSVIIPKQKYSSNIKASYRADVEPTNFVVPEQAAKKINLWIANETNGYISDLVQPEELDDVVLLIANAVFFKGLWRKAFPKNTTFISSFHTTPTSVVSVEYMNNIGNYYYGESKDLDAQILRLPYKGDKFAFFVLLPNSKAGLSKLIKSLDLTKLKRSMYNLDKVVVDVTLPKFKFDFSLSYSSILQKFGLQQLFADTASLPGIARGLGYGYKKLQVSDIRQKSGIEVNEEGSIIYTATDIQVGNKFGDVDNIFNATYPFMFFIEDQISGTIVFIGKIVNPLANKQEPITVPVRLSENSEGRS